MLTREQERRIEVWGEVRPYEQLDFDDVCFALLMQERARQREAYRDLKMFDPRGHREYVAKNVARRKALYTAREGYRARLRDRDAKEMRLMYAAGASVKAIAAAYDMWEGNIRGVLDGRSHPNAGGPIRSKPPGKLFHRDAPCPKQTPELMAAVAVIGGSNRHVSRQLGISHALVAAVRRKLAAAERAEAAE